MSAPTYAECAQELAALGCEQGAAEFHGLLCGLLCRGDGLSQARQEAGLPADGDLAVLQALAEYSLRCLRGNQSDFSPLLPEDEQQLNQRVVALADWCEAFLHGLALKPGLDMQALSEDARELVADLTELSRAGVDAEESGEVEEQAYVELVEYLRIAVQILFIELSGQVRETADVDDNQDVLH